MTADSDRGLMAALLRAHDQMSAPIAVLRGPDLVYEYANAFYMHFGQLEAPVGTRFGESGHTAAPAFRAQLERAYATGEVVSLNEVRIAHNRGPLAGQTRFFDVRLVPLRDTRGEVDGVLIHGFDITDLVSARERAIRDEAQLRRLMEANLLGVGFFVGWTLVDANDELLRVLGFDRDDLRAGRIVWSELTPPEHAEATARARRDLELKGWYVPFEKEYFRKDGTRVSVLVGGASSGPADVGAAFVLDLTARKEAERRGAELQERLLHLEKVESLGVLAGGIAHDFNNLLAIVLGNISAAALSASQDNALQPLLADAMTGVRKASDLTRQLLAYAGKADIRVERVDLSNTVAEFAQLLRASVPRSVALEMDLRPSLPPIVADAAQVHQIAMNLILNAAEAIGEEPGSVSVTTAAVEVDARRAAALVGTGDAALGTYVALEVRDSGRGMDETTRQRIFDPFFTTKRSGRGLGLASVLGIVRAHRGGIEVESAMGAGTTFRALFPAASGAVALREENGAAEFRGSGVALLVDDDPGVRKVTRLLLEMSGFDVVAAGGGAEAVATLTARRDDFCVVVLDMTMPGMSGESTFHALRSIRPEVPIVLSSGYDESDARRWLNGVPRVAFLKKPFSRGDLAIALREAFASR